MPSYLLKVTKFLGKISQVEFLVITKKNVFAHKLFLSLNISDFNLLCHNCIPSPWKKSSSSFPATPSKSWDPVKPPFFYIWLEAQPPPSPCRKGGGSGTQPHYEAPGNLLIREVRVTCSKLDLDQLIQIQVMESVSDKIFKIYIYIKSSSLWHHQLGK